MIVVAGDISYANGMRSCYRRWDDWLTTWHRHLRTVEGYLVPLVTSIGNHDVGMCLIHGFNLSILCNRTMQGLVVTVHTGLGYLCRANKLSMQRNGRIAKLITLM